MSLKRTAKGDRPRSGLLVTCVVMLASQTLLAQEKAGETITPPDRRDVQTEVLQAVAQLGIKDETALDRVTKLWANPDAKKPRDVFELAVRSFSAVHPDTARFLDACQYNRAAVRVPSMPKVENAPQAYVANVGLFYGRYLAQRRLYDEAYEVLKTIEPKSVADPATLLFFKAVCEQQLFRKKDGLQTLETLLQKTVGVPVSYRQVAELMEYELKNVEEKSLEEISKMMSDVGRRLDLGRGGERVQRKEAEIIARLDEMIEDMEQQQQGGGGGGAGAQGGQENAPAGGAQASRVKGTKGKGDADRKKLANKGGWGMLDSKAETKARASIKRRFPAHYGEAIKRYNIKLAK